MKRYSVEFDSVFELSTLLNKLKVDEGVIIDAMCETLNKKGAKCTNSDNMIIMIDYEENGPTLDELKQVTMDNLEKRDAAFAKYDTIKINKP